MNNCIVIAIGNIKHFIQAKCFYGVKNNVNCQWVYKTNVEIACLCTEKIRIIFVPVLHCIKHDKICKLYTWKDEKERLLLHKNDKIINKFRFWFTSPMNDEETSDSKNYGNGRLYLQSRYIISDKLLSSIARKCVRKGGSITQWYFFYIYFIFILYLFYIYFIFCLYLRCIDRIGAYVDHARIIWNEHGESYDNLHVDTMMEEIKAFFQPKTIKHIIDSLALGYFTYANEEVDKELMTNMWIREIYLDASHQTVENVICKEKNKSGFVNVLKVTESRACINMGLNIGDTYLLEGGKERHKIMFAGQLGKIYANNMRYIKKEKIPKHFIIHTQSDRATHDNVNNVRGILVNGIKQSLDIPLHSTSFVRQRDGGEFRFDLLRFVFFIYFLYIFYIFFIYFLYIFYIIIIKCLHYRFIHSQEIHHIDLRLLALGAYKRGHSDHGCVRGDIKFIIRNMRLQYHPVESPVILYTAVFEGPTIINEPWMPPYELFAKTTYIKNEEYFFVISRAVRALWMRRKTNKPKLQSQLDRYWHKNWTQNIGRDKLRKEFIFIIKHSVPHLIAAFFSVNYFIFVLYNFYICFMYFLYLFYIIFIFVLYNFYTI